MDVAAALAAKVAASKPASKPTGSPANHPTLRQSSAAAMQRLAALTRHASRANTRKVITLERLVVLRLAAHHPYGLMRTPNITTAEPPAASVPTLALTVPVLPLAGAVIAPWLLLAATAAW